MTINRKIGLSYYKIHLNEDETKRYKEANSRGKKVIAREAWVREQFGSPENAINAVKALEPGLKKIEAKMNEIEQ